MDRGRPPYHERFLHWIWGALHFDLNRLNTICGKPVTVLDPGELNTTDGPDFRKARIQIGELVWYGDIEIHWNAEGWTHHGHHRNSRYNRVILHVVYEEPGRHRKIRRQDGTLLPYTLALRPYLPVALHELTDRFHQTHRLPCAGSVHYISEEAFASQLERAHRQYFEVKAENLLNLFYRPELTPSLAWKRMLILGLFDGLGISHNREPMTALGRELFERRGTVSGPRDLNKLARLLAGLTPRAEFGEVRPLTLRWNRKGCRPANHPDVRIGQAAELMWQVLEDPFERWFRQDPDSLWSAMISSVSTTPGIGKGRSGILYGVVFLPCLYLLGTLFQAESLRRRAFNLWETYKTGIPRSLFKLYENSDIPAGLYEGKLGAVYQLKHYCRPRRCQDCKVLHQAIYS